MTPNLQRRRWLALCATAAALPAWRTAAAQGYPARPLTLVVPYAPGGQGDVFARLIGERLVPALGQPVIVDNRPGASGAVGARLVARAPADGYTLLLGQTGEIAVNGAAMRQPGYDPLRDFRPVALVGDSPLVMAVPANSPHARLQDLLQAARERPDAVAYASSGTATPGHLAAATLAAATRTAMVHVPYKGAGQAITDLIGGQVQFFFSSASAILPHVRGGRVRALAVASPQPLAALPGAAPVAQLVPGFEFSLWAACFAPRATPDAVVELLHAQIRRIVAEPALRARLEAEGSAVEPMPLERMQDFVRAEIAKYATLVQARQARID